MSSLALEEEHCWLRAGSVQRGGATLPGFAQIGIGGTPVSTFLRCPGAGGQELGRPGTYPIANVVQNC